jgi:hypothetical protein
MRNPVMAFITLVLLVPVAAQAQIACGATIAKGEHVALDQDLGPCDGVDAAVTIDGGSLDLGGHTIVCADLDQDGELPMGVVLVGRRSKLSNGAVVECANGVAAAGRGRHRVKDVTTSFNQDDGFDLLPEADRTRLTGVVAIFNGDDGIQVRSDRSRIMDATATANGRDGVDLWSSAERTKVVRVATVSNGDAGVLVEGARNDLVETVSSLNVIGIDLDGAQNRVRGGTSDGNGSYDLANCAGDRVKEMTFTTATPDCE